MFALTAFYGIHTFKFIARDDAVTLVKWRFVPQDGEWSLSDTEMTSLPRASSRLR